MAQQLLGDFPIDPLTTNGTELADILNRLSAATQSTNAGPAGPPSTYSGQMWLDTSAGGNGILRMRDAANAAWFPVFDSSLPPLSSTGGTMSGKLTIAPAGVDAELWLQAAAGKVAAVRAAGNARVPGVDSFDMLQDATGAHLMQRAAQPLQVWTGGAERGRFDAQGLQVTGAVRASGMHTFTADTDTGLTQAGAGMLTLQVDGVALLTATPTGIGASQRISVKGADVGLLLNRTSAAQPLALTGAVNDKMRWQLELGDVGAETGGNTGSNLRIMRADDAGAFNATPVFYIMRNNGEVGASSNFHANALWLNNVPGFGLFDSTPQSVLAFDAGSYFSLHRGNKALQFTTNSGTLCMFGADYNFYWWNGSCAKPGGGPWESISDARVKTDVQAYTHGLEQVLQLQPRTFRYNAASGLDTARVFVGLVAQEVQEVMPEMVGSTPIETLREGGKYLHVDAPALLTLDTNALAYALVNAAQELKALVDALTQRVSALEG